MAETKTELSDRQFEFSKKQSTDDVTRALLQRVYVANIAGPTAVTVSLNIQHAFNTVGWEVTKTSLVRMSFPPYLRHIIRSYLENCVLELQADNYDDRENMGISCGVNPGIRF